MRFAFGVQYLGTRYHGWQRQPNMSTVQSELEKAFSKVADDSIEVTGSGRTDTGVHASGQVAHFETDKVRDSFTWISGVNRFLPDDINVTFVQEVPNDFHARFSAEKRTYKFLIFNHSTRSSCFHRLAVQEYLTLDEQLMNKAAQLFVGKHDFASIQDSDCQSHSSIREVMNARVCRKRAFVIFEITANAFLHHMVRNIMGLLVPVGLQKEPVRWVKDVLQAKDRAKGGVTYPPHGLYLHRISYPKRYTFQRQVQDYIIDMFD